MSETIPIIIDGREMNVPAGRSVAAAVMGAGGEPALRQAISGAPRAALCGMGVCFECRATIDGVAHQRSCKIACQPHMRVNTTGFPSASGSSGSTGSNTGCNVPLISHPQGRIGRSGGGENGQVRSQAFDVVVVGGGPAGIAAACAAAQGARVGIIDDNPDTGGQIWRGERASAMSPLAKRWFARINKANVTFLGRTQIFAAPSPGVLLGENEEGPCEIHYSRLILATGARELFLPFPGWTLPNVMGAGGLQAMVKSGLPIRGKRVIVAGSGPLLLAVAASLVKKGADVRAIVEQAPAGRIAGFAMHLLTSPGKLCQALSLNWQLHRANVPLHLGAWPLEAHGNDRLQSVTFTNGSRSWTEKCDYLACGFGLVPNVELAALLGCEIADGAVRVGELQQTSVPNIYCAGEAAGIGGADMALAQGQIAGYAAIGRTDAARAVFSSRARAARFAARIDRTFALRSELRSLARPETIVCRCEDVTLAQLSGRASWLSAKLQTRCGMGACQGRVCGQATTFLFGWKPTSVRPPIFPVSLESLISSGATPERR